MSHLNFGIFLPIFVYLIKIDLSGNTVLPQASGFQKLAKIDHFGIFGKLLSTQNVIVARFAHNAECDFFCDFQTPWLKMRHFRWNSELFMLQRAAQRQKQKAD